MKYPIIKLIRYYRAIFGKLAILRSSHSADYASLNKQKICPITLPDEKAGGYPGDKVEGSTAIQAQIYP